MISSAMEVRQKETPSTTLSETQHLRTSEDAANRFCEQLAQEIETDDAAAANDDVAAAAANDDGRDELVEEEEVLKK